LILIELHGFGLFFRCPIDFTEHILSDFRRIKAIAIV
jgi:hypothetical protein